MSAPSWIWLPAGLEASDGVEVDSVSENWILLPYAKPLPDACLGAPVVVAESVLKCLQP